MDILIDQVKMGNSEAFSVIYKNNVDRVYALCLRMSGNKMKARELTQDVFVRAWKKINKFSGNSSFATWLYRLTVNVVVGKLKKEKIINTREVSVEELSNDSSLLNSLKIDEKMDLEAAISCLPHKSRIVLTLHDIEGYKHEEIGKFMGISPQTSRVHLYQARNILREYLK